MLESAVEKYLKKEVEKRGGLCWKFESPGNAGVPDRVVMMPGAPVVFIELKAPGEKPRKLQLKQHDRMRAVGVKVNVFDCYEDIDRFIEDYENPWGSTQC